jgi:hypothetical protein
LLLQLLDQIAENEAHSSNTWRYTINIKQKTFLLAFHQGNALLFITSLMNVGRKGYNLLLDNVFHTGLPSYHNVIRWAISQVPAALTEMGFQIKRFFSMAEHYRRLGMKALVFHACNDAVAVIPQATHCRTNDRVYGLAIPDEELYKQTPIAGRSYELAQDLVNEWRLANCSDSLLLCPLNPKFPAVVIAVWAQKGPVSADVHKLRWETAEKYLRQMGIHIISHGADGDNAHLKAMNDRIAERAVIPDATVIP